MTTFAHVMFSSVAVAVVTSRLQAAFEGDLFAIKCKLNRQLVCLTGTLRDKCNCVVSDTMSATRKVKNLRPNNPQLCEHCFQETLEVVVASGVGGPSKVMNDAAFAKKAKNNCGIHVTNSLTSN